MSTFHRTLAPSLCILACAAVGIIPDLRSKAWGQETRESNAVKLNISLSKTKFKLGEPIVLEVLLKNYSSESFVYAQSATSLNYQIDLKIKGAEAVSLGERGKMLQPKVRESTIKGVLAKGDSLSEKINLEGIFQLQSGITYTLVARRTVYNSKNDPVVVESTFVQFELE